MPSFATTVGYMGRWQILGNTPLIIADSAHNEGGLKYVFQKIKEINFDRLHIVTGMVNEKSRRWFYLYTLKRQLIILQKQTYQEENQQVYFRKKLRHLG